MLSKNNYNEKLRKMKLQARQDHFSIRKLTVGVASVLLGYAFFGAGSQTVKADTESIAQQADDKTESVSEKPHVNDNAIKLGSSKNTGTDGDKKNAASTSSVQKSAPDNTVSGVQTDVAKKADTDQVAKNGLTKEHLKKDGSDQGDIESVRNNRKFDITSTIQTVQIRVNNAYSSSSKDQDDLNTKNDYLAQIDKIDNELLAKLNAGKNVEEIDSTAETAIKDILNLAAAAELHFAKKTTIDAITSKANVDEQANNAKKSVIKANDKIYENLVDEEKKQADTDFTTADSIQKIYLITDKTIKNIFAVKSDADQAELNKYNVLEPDEIAELIEDVTDTQTLVNELIDNLPNISAERKSSLKDKVNLYYQTTINNIEKAGDLGLADTEKSNGIIKINTVYSEASNLNQQIGLDQKNLDEYAQKVTENINNSNLSEADKEKAKKAISQACDDAKNIVGQQPTVERADAAEKAGKAIIDAIEKAAYLADLERAKLIEKIRVENAAENAKNKVQDEYNNLGQDGKDKEKGKLEKALEAIEKAKNDAEAAISSATDKNNVSTISKTGIDKINGVTDDTSLEFAKESAKETVQQISDIVKQNLKDPNDQNAVDKINKDAVENLDQARNIHEVTKFRDAAIDQIKQIKNTADNKENNDLSNDKSSSRNAVDVDANAALDRVNKAYEKLTETEKSAKKDEYDAAIKAITDAKNAAKDKIDSAPNVDAIIAAVSKAQQEFNTIATNAEVSFAKLAGKDKIQDAAAQANKVLSPKGQAAVKDIVTQANSDIEDAETVAKIEKITEAAINKIKALQDSEKTDLENAIKYANDEFEKKYKEAIARLKKEFSDSAKTTEVDNVFNKYKGITGSTVAEVNAKEIAAERELAKGEVCDTATNAEARVDNLKHKDGTVYTDNEKKALKKQIQKDVLEANGSKDQSGTLDKPSDTEGIDTVRNEAVNKIISEAIADSQEGENVLQHDPDVLLERLAKAHKAAVDKLQKFGPNINHDQTDKNYEEAKKALSSNPTDLATELAGEKLIANGALSDAKTAADNIVDSNTDYSSTVKDKIKQQIQKDFDKATNRINESPAVSELITQKRNDGIDQLYRDAIDTNVNVTNVINSGGGSDQVTNITNINPDNNQNNQTPNMPENSQEPAKTVRVVLNHNAYLYDNNGHRANGIILGIGSILETIGTETINNRQYYVLVDQGANGKKYYVAAGNVKGTAKQLHHNAYIYNQYGKRVRKYGKLKAGKAVRTYGSSVKIRSKKYYIVAKNRFVKAANFTSHKEKTTVKKAKEVAAVAAADQSQVIINKKVMHNAYLYDENGVRANGLVINTGSTIDVSTQKVINKRVYYALENGLYIAAGNIDAKKLKLEHNAYVYSKYGNRLGKKVLKKHKSVNTYGTAVRIKGKKYYTLTTSEFVKKANFKG
ncbi:SLAP domain-containing protein [Lactobacillus sp. ESL0261]|uniref:SLAP domain-containing protein n=1 Tax=Lactobacillus sp. ESL0261 TaxID=2069348 RepID=UPI001314068C|nr:SLAP domain-containing protein [Lactobacillus sp. ESL0261]